MKSDRLFLIINPVSGTRSKEGLERNIADRLGELGFETTIRFTGCRGDATRLARQAVAENFDGVLACGGDGTVNETAMALAGTGVAMGILPAGSGNGLARHIGIPVDPLAAIDIIAERHITDCDYGVVDGHPFFCTFGVGFDAAVSERFANSGSRGRMSYIKSALHEFTHYRPETYSVTADGEVIADEAFLVAVCNASQYGNNAFIAPDASITDGLLDLIIIPKQPRVSTVIRGFEMMAGTLAGSHGIIKRKAARINIKRDICGPAHLDGEPFPHVGTEFNIECRPHGIRLFTTASKTPFRPVITPVRSMLSDIMLAARNTLGKK